MDSSFSKVFSPIYACNDSGYDAILMRSRQTELARDEEAALAHPVLFLEEGYILFTVRDTVFLQPDVEHQLADEPVDTGFIGRIAADVHPVLNLEQDVEHPLAVGVVEVFAHDEHVKHMRPGALHDGIMCLDVFRIIRANDFVKGLQAFCMMGVQVMGFVRFDVIATFVGHDDRCLGQQPLPVRPGQDCRPLALDRVRFLIGEVAAVMDKPRIIRLQVLPRPVQGRQFAVMRILGADVVAGIVTGEADAFFALTANVNRHVDIILRHPIRLVRRNHDFYIQAIHLSSV